MKYTIDDVIELAYSKSKDYIILTNLEKPDVKKEKSMNNKLKSPSSIKYHWTIFKLATTQLD